MKLNVLHDEGGRILSLSRANGPSGRGDAGVPLPRSGAEPGNGQRVAVVDLDTQWEDCSLKEIHERFSVSHDSRGVTLMRRADARQD